MNRLVQLRIKRLADILVSSAALVLLSPLMVIIALWIRKDSSGPVIYRQRRIGLNGKVFEILKFRTMLFDAPDLRNPDGSTYTGSDDPRVTKSGKFLRRTSLDELPQFLNVLKGEMSIIGPRPEKDDQRWMYRPGDERKLHMRPGITGYAAVHGRNNIPWKERVALDIHYVERYSLWLDALIVAKTIPTVLGGGGVETTTVPMVAEAKTPKAVAARDE